VLLDGKVPIFRVRYSLGKSCMTSFWIGWSLPFLSSISQIPSSLWDAGMPRVLKIVVMPHNCATCKGWRPSLWHMQLLFSIRRSSSPLSTTTLLLKYCFRVLSAFRASTIYFTVRGYVSSSSLQFAKHWFNRIVLSSSESPCLSRTKILSTSTIFG